MHSSQHISVMMQEVLELFSTAHLRVFFEGTVGLGGHAKALLTAHPEIERYIAVDHDPSALEVAKKVLEPWKKKVVFLHGDFAECLEEADGFFLI